MRTAPFKRPKRRPRRVLLAFVWYEFPHLEGIYRYVREAGWTLSRCMPGETHAIRTFKPHGILCQLHGSAPDMVQEVKASTAPKVELITFLNDPRIPAVVADVETEGRRAAEHLVERGFKHLVFVGMTRDLGRTAPRYQGFNAVAARAGCDVITIDTRDSAIRHQTGEDRHHSRLIHDECSVRRRRWIGRYFASVPKPAGVFAEHSVWGSDIIEGCIEADIPVPEQVAVVTVVDMEHEGEMFAVPATVIVPDYETQAYQAAALLDRMMRGEQVGPNTIVRIPPKSLVIRESTMVRAVDDIEVARAVALIMRSLHDQSLTASRVVQMTGISRRTLYRDFVRHMGDPIARYIRRLRVKDASVLLETTARSVTAIADECGFSDIRQFCSALVRETGMTPSAYRAAAAAKRS